MHIMILDSDIEKGMMLAANLPCCSCTDVRRKIRDSLYLMTIEEARSNIIFNSLYTFSLNFGGGDEHFVIARAT
jgi:hypothetical protein